jgi:ELWxxDGT repeat protein/cysteine-rich repeat protein
MGNLLFFSAQNPAFGRELWVTDGTEVGTRLAADVNPVRSAYPESIVELGGTLFFYADDGGSGEELWAPAACGNGVASPGEQCDDGNLESGDGCSAECRAEQTEPPPPQEGCTAERVCVEGSRLHVRGRSTLGVRVWIRGEGIVPPAPRNPLAPGLGGAMLEVTNPVTGEAMHLSLPAEGWKPRTFRAGMGFRYEGNRLTGCARVDLMPGAIRARCRRPAAELTLDEPSQTQLVVKLHLGPETRYCAAFGGEVERDCGIRDARHGVFLARAAPAPTSCE